jgi:hypothetical protein
MGLGVFCAQFLASISTLNHTEPTQTHLDFLGFQIFLTDDVSSIITSDLLVGYPVPIEKH